MERVKRTVAVRNSFRNRKPGIKIIPGFLFMSNIMNAFLEPIITYQMDPLQASAYKIGLLWIFISKKKFPDYKHHTGYPKKGDPRKSLLFKHCYKLIRETQGLISFDEYNLYIKAQLDILKSIDVNGSHPLISPNCISGDKAWIRWKMWKRKYDKLNQNTTAAEAGVAIDPIHEIIVDLKRARAFLEGRLGEGYKEEQVMMAARDMTRWLSIGKLTPYYIILSPWAKKYVNPGIDLDLYKPGITPEVEKEFIKLFTNEIN